MAAAAPTAGKENAGAAANTPAPGHSTAELKTMLGQCLKMASENKITAQNTWALHLIEHLPELIREEGGAQTNFQRASVTLDAGVKIYSYRVDSVHTETFKILGGLGRASKDADEPDGGWAKQWQACDAQPPQLHSSRRLCPGILQVFALHLTFPASLVLLLYNCSRRPATADAAWCWAAKLALVVP